MRERRVLRSSSLSWQKMEMHNQQNAEHSGVGYTKLLGIAEGETGKRQGVCIDCGEKKERGQQRLIRRQKKTWSEDNKNHFDGLKIYLRGRRRLPSFQYITTKN